ncbi:hypothetical protein [Frigoriglobus tundricola]|uniref:Uncharacterized protein n=1 Tax=Frigoriglobus tundricola TaxID=2774151 RepID=A0A6M5YH46_9BACT|nr:hypothetical protein [Frigoriglobus tundricola]QJW93379.1 hypothetical protein FTUN_0885 [Frigoriglobus tundricola]
MSHDASLEPILRAVEPALRLVPERHLRQILNFLIDRGRVLPTNGDLPFWLARADVAAAAVLPREVLSGTDARLLLVTEPNDRLIADKPRAEQLRDYWRVLYRAAVMNAIDHKLASGALNAEQCRERMHRFGPAAAREIRYVLEAEHLAAPGAGEVDLYRTFAAVYLDLYHFTAHAVEEFFPALPHGGAVRGVLAGDVGADALLAAARPEGAADPEPEPSARRALVRPPDRGVCGNRAPSPGAAAALLQRATEAESNGNVVRAAVLRTQAAGASQGPDREHVMTAALAALGQLVNRLGDTLDWDADTREEWRQALGPLLPVAARGIWPRAARCLYELQRIPADYSRKVYAVDLPEYIRTLGRRPIRRELPHAQPVMVLMAFRKAHKQLLRGGLGEPEQLRLDRLLHHEIHRREHAIRHTFAPIIAAEITGAGLVPASRAEEVGARQARRRAAGPRVRARLPPHRRPARRGGAEPVEAPRPRRARASSSAATRSCAPTRAWPMLDGVYRRGEFYLRWIQRFVSVFFGTPWGRALTLYLALPFGGAFLGLMFAEELRHISTKVAKFVSRSFAPPAARILPPPPIAPVPTPAPPAAPAAPAAEPAHGAAEVGDWQFDEDRLEFYWDSPGNVDPPEPDPLPRKFLNEQKERASIAETVFLSSAAHQKPTHHASFLVEWPTILGFGVFLLLVFHVPPFRRAVGLVLGHVWTAVRGLLWDVPLAVWHSRTVRNLRLSGTARFVHRHFASPLLTSLLILGVTFIVGVPLAGIVRYGWAIYLAMLVFYNTPPGWEFQDRISEALSDWWRRVRTNLIPGLLAGIIDLFRALANWVERQLYAVDEWMRFRGGDSQGSLALKAVLGLIWFPIAYVTRFVFYLLVEPQVNPVKHFPVVTVSHKVIWPMVPQIAEWTGQTAFTVGMVVNGVPGIFGFIAWELKENWRLYAANRSRALGPAMVGSHGESMRGMLRPGFHSGTVPKLYRKARQAIAAGDRPRAALAHHDLAHAAEGVHRFAERELLPLLAGSNEWGGVAVEVAAVRFGVQRVEVDLAAPALGRTPFVLAFENMSGQVEASVAQLGWADKLTEAQRGVFRFALRGLLDMAAGATYEGRARTPDAPDAPGLDALARRVAWGEWVRRWGAATAPEKPAAAPDTKPADHRTNFFLICVFCVICDFLNASRIA